MEAGALVGAVTPELIAAKIAQGRREIAAAFAAEDFELARFLVRRNAGYRLFFAPRILRRRPPPTVGGIGANNALVTLAEREAREPGSGSLPSALDSGARGACHRAALCADPLARPE